MTRAVAIDMEARLLGLCLTSREAATRAVASLSPEAFMDRAHRKVFRAVQGLVAQNKTPSPVAVMQAGADQEVEAALGRLLDAAAIPADLDALIDAIREAHARRTLIAMADELKKAAEEAPDLDALQELAAKRAMAVASAVSGSDSPVRHIREGLTDVVLALQGEGPVVARRISFGFYRSLGSKLRGLQASRLYVIAARPSMGKTALALQMAWQALDSGSARNVLLVSLEMSLEDIAARLLAQRLGVNVDEAMDWSREWRLRLVSEMQDGLNRLAGLGLWVSDRRGLRVPEIVAMAHRLAFEQGGLDMLVVDHLGLIALPGGKDKTTAEKLGEVTRTLRRLAGDLNMPVILVAQLNRDVEHRDDKRPTMADLRGSGEIEQDADVVLGLYRHRYYEPDLDEEDPRSDKAEAWVLKNRTGEAGITIILRWNPQFVRFEECSDAERDAYEAAVGGAA